MTRLKRGALLIALFVPTMAYQCGQTDPELTGSIAVSAVDSLGVEILSARVFVDGEPAGRTPALVEREHGLHRVDVDSTGFISVPEDTTVRVTIDEVSHVTMTLISEATAPTTGFLVVTAIDASAQAVIGAPVSVDGSPAGRTPLNLELDIGSYSVSIDTLGFIPSFEDTTVVISRGEATALQFALTRGFYRTILCEDFTNTDCMGCPETEELLLDVTAGTPFSEVVTVSVHTRIPGFQDPFFQANLQEFLIRSEQFYNIGGNPRIAVDGALLDGIPPSGADLRDSIAAHVAAIPAPIHLDVSHVIDGNQISIDVTVRSIADIPGDLRLLVMTVLTDYDHGSAIGDNGQSHFTRVIRDFEPTVNGEALTVTAGMEQDFHYHADLFNTANPPDVPDKMAVVAVVQDWSTKEILQTASTLE